MSVTLIARHKGTQVEIAKREFNGVDKAEYTPVHTMEIGEAKQLSISLIGAIKDAENAASDRNKARLEEIDRRAQALQAELAGLALEKRKLEAGG